ncbi:MAG: PilZ domain-containing protein [Pseudolabrys sp.]|nr:PilZ domain-containing protein [Pseudolabrys sp.]
MSEIRNQIRRRVTIPGWLETPSGKRIPITLANVSEDGAQLCIGPDFALPASFILLLTRDGQIKRGCRILWQKGDRIGVRFFRLPGDSA